MRDRDCEQFIKVVHIVRIDGDEDYFLFCLALYIVLLHDIMYSLITVYVKMHYDLGRNHPNYPNELQRRLF